MIATLDPVRPPVMGKRRWPLIIVALLGGHTLLMLGAVFIATRDPGFSVDPGYYQKSLQWDQRQAMKRASEQLGWRAEVLPADAQLDGRRHVRVTLVDRAGAAIPGAKVEARYFHHAHGREAATASFTAAAGAYQADLRMPWRGVWQFELTATAGGQTYVNSMVVEVLR
jgi:nitrogen fixation protein FixH